MSWVKRQLENQYAYEEIAKDILKSIGAIGTCPFHEDEWYYDNYMDENEVYAMATRELKAEYPNMNDLKLFHASIKNVLNYASSDSTCPFCEND
ncbi:MAG: hypothetical protein NC177_00210 [Ruminococcus flavefaciens]|nr:hypothetical protein [Ruminococcus flavefaciens]